VTEIDLVELRTIVDRLLDHLIETRGVRTVTLETPYYWEVPAPERYNVEAVGDRLSPSLQNAGDELPVVGEIADLEFGRRSSITWDRRWPRSLARKTASLPAPQQRRSASDRSLAQATGGWIRDDAIAIEVTVPGERWEIEWLESGDIEIEIFRSSGEIFDDQALSELLAGSPTEPTPARPTRSVQPTRALPDRPFAARSAAKPTTCQTHKPAGLEMPALERVDTTVRRITSGELLK
jgi:hypothetical protein